MSSLDELELGVMFWAKPDPLETIREVKSFGVRCGQLGIPGDFPLKGAADKWQTALEAEKFQVVTVFCAYDGESYADVPTVQRTVGLVPESTRTAREQRTREVSDFAAELGVKSIACHVGFIPELVENQGPTSEYLAIRDTVRGIAEYAARNGQTFAMETGQEPAEELLKFLAQVNQPNVGVNFDPANMILYGTGDPLNALDLLSAHVLSVHAKDGQWPAKRGSTVLGCETPLGEGAVGIEAFLSKLQLIGYKGTIHVEREVEDPEERRRDIAAGLQLLRGLLEKEVGRRSQVSYSS